MAPTKKLYIPLEEPLKGTLTDPLMACFPATWRRVICGIRALQAPRRRLRHLGLSWLSEVLGHFSVLKVRAL